MARLLTSTHSCTTLVVAYWSIAVAVGREWQIYKDRERGQEIPRDCIGSFISCSQESVLNAPAGRGEEVGRTASPYRVMHSPVTEVGHDVVDQPTCWAIQGWAERIA